MSSGVLWPIMWLWILEVDQSDEYERDGRVRRSSQIASPDRLRARPCSRGAIERWVPAMMNSAIVRIVDFCARRRWTIAIAGVLLMLGAAAFDAARFSINTDIEGLIFQDLPWRQREL